MTLPNYFLADLPPEATFSSQMLEEACLTLKRNRERHLANRSTHRMIQLIAEVGKAWLDPQCASRKLALEQPAETIGFSRETVRNGLDHFCSELTVEKLENWVIQEFGVLQRLDEFTSSLAEEAFGRTAMASGPELLVHITAGNVPVSSLSSMVTGLILRSAQFVKCASGATFLPRLFAHSIYQADPKVGSCIEIAAWPGGNQLLEQPLFDAADCVTASGSEETLDAIRKRLSPRSRFVGYGHRLSFAFLSSDMLNGSIHKETMKRTCDDVVAWNQLGCLSPHVIYVQDGGLIGPEKFAELLADALCERESLEPRGSLPPEIAAAISSRRSLYEIRAAHMSGTRHWCSAESTAWTVVYEADPRFQLSCLNRFIYVKSVKDLTEALQAADKVKGKVSTVGLGALKAKAAPLVLELARWGVPRVCPIGSMQKPPLAWRHDGRPALGDLVSWTDWETQ